MKSKFKPKHFEKPHSEEKEPEQKRKKKQEQKKEHNDYKRSNNLYIADQTLLIPTPFYDDSHQSSGDGYSSAYHNSSPHQQHHTGGPNLHIKDTISGAENAVNSELKQVGKIKLKPLGDTTRNTGRVLKSSTVAPDRTIGQIAEFSNKAANTTKHSLNKYSTRKIGQIIPSNAIEESDKANHEAHKVVESGARKIISGGQINVGNGAKTIERGGRKFADQLSQVKPSGVKHLSEQTSNVAGQVARGTTTAINRAAQNAHAPSLPLHSVIREVPSAIPSPRGCMQFMECLFGLFR